MPLEETGITAIPDQAVFTALKQFQKDYGLMATGVTKPDDETIHLLSTESDKSKSGYYIWRTVGDSKVRKAHTQYSGTKRAWDDSPDPGEDFNCRCWAEPVKNSILHDIDDKKIMDDIENFELFVPYMYRDTHGNITIGIGLMLKNVKAAQALPLVITDTRAQGGKRPAHPDEIERAFRSILQLPYQSDYRHTKFNPVTDHRLSPIYISREIALRYLKDHLYQDALNLRRKFPKFDSYPVEAQKALLDMEYNLGTGNFTRHHIIKGKEKGWPNLFSAIDKQDWLLAAKHSHRNLGKDETRNQKIKTLFEKAAEKSQRLE